VEHENTRYRILALILQGNGLSIRNNEIDPAPTLQMTSCLRDIGLGHVDAERGEPGPSLFEKIEGTSGTAANVQKPEAALITSGEYLVERPQRLSPSSIGRSIKKHFHLRIIALR
jgi:hypothetical protein